VGYAAPPRTSTRAVHGDEAIVAELGQDDSDRVVADSRLGQADLADGELGSGVQEYKVANPILLCVR
jgi:hypothetical protein